MELRDLICELKVFLEESLIEEKLSEEVDRQRIILLAKLNARCKSPSPPAYINMTKTILSRNSSVNIMDTSYESMKIPPPPDVVNNHQINRSSTPTIPYSASASALRISSPISGILHKPRKCPFVSILPPKKFWAALNPSGGLYLYGTENDQSPAYQINLDGYSARLVHPRPRKDNTFELICPGKKTYQLIAPTSKEMNIWLNCISDICKKIDGKTDHLYSNVPMENGNHRYSTLPRQLPPTPATNNVISRQESPLLVQEHYDIPDSRVRPVTNSICSSSGVEEYEQMCRQDSLYHCIEDRTFNPSPLSNDSSFKNPLVDVDENTYYNVIKPKINEEIYQTITEKSINAESVQTENKSFLDSTLLSSNKRYSGRVQQIVKAMEGQDTINVTKIELYEPVDTSRDNIISNRLSR